MTYKSSFGQMQKTALLYKLEQQLIYTSAYGLYTCYYDITGITKVSGILGILKYTA